MCHSTRTCNGLGVNEPTLILTTVTHTKLIRQWSQIHWKGDMAWRSIGRAARALATATTTARPIFLVVRCSGDDDATKPRACQAPRCDGTWKLQKRQVDGSLLDDPDVAASADVVPCCFEEHVIQAPAPATEQQVLTP